MKRRWSLSLNSSLAALSVLLTSCGPGISTQCKPIVETPVFSTSVVDPSAISGWLAPGVPRFGAISPGMLLAPSNSSVPIGLRAPAALELARGSYYQISSEGVSRDVYFLEFRIGCNWSVWFDEVTAPSAAIVAALKNPTLSTSIAGGLVDVPAGTLAVTAGTSLGSSLGGLDNRVEFGVARLDASSTPGNRTRLRSEVKGLLKEFSTCPLDFFTSALRSEWNALGDELDGSTAASVSCGNGMKDVVGTLAGDWVADGGPGSGFSSQLSLALSPTGKRVRVSGLSQGNLDVLDTLPTFKDPATVSSQHCFSRGLRHVFLKLDGNDRLLVSQSDVSSTCPVTLPTTGVQVFIR